MADSKVSHLIDDLSGAHPVIEIPPSLRDLLSTSEGRAAFNEHARWLSESGAMRATYPDLSTLRIRWRWWLQVDAKFDIDGDSIREAYLAIGEYFTRLANDPQASERPLTEFFTAAERGCFSLQLWKKVTKENP